MDKVDIFVIVAAVFVFAFMALIFVLVAIEAKKEQKDIAGDKYDERQKLIQYKAVAASFIVFLVLQLIIALLADLEIYNFEAAFRGWALSGYISIAVMMTYMILKDADMTPAQIKIGPDCLYALLLIVGVSVFCVTIRNIIAEAFTENNFLSIVLAVVIIYIAAIHFAKNAWDKKHKKISDDDDLPTGINSEGE